MRHRSKRFLSILLSLVLMLGLIPDMSLTAYATNVCPECHRTDYYWDEEFGCYVCNQCSAWFDNPEDGKVHIGDRYYTYDPDKPTGNGGYGGLSLITMNVGDIIQFEDLTNYITDQPLHDGCQSWNVDFEGSNNENVICESDEDYNSLVAVGSGETTFVVRYYDVEYDDCFADAVVTFAVSVSEVAVTGVTIDPSSATLTAGGDAVALTAAVDPSTATDKAVKWSVGGTNAGAVALYTDEACTQAVGADATSILTVYAKGVSTGDATVTATSNADSTKAASCNVTVNAAAATTNVTIDMTAQGWSNQQDVTSVSDSGNTVTATFGKGDSSNAPKYYNTGDAVRLYAKNTMTVSAASPITSIAFNFGSGDNTNEITASAGSFDGTTWTGSATSVTFTIGGTSGHRRIQTLTIKVTGETAPAAPAYTPVPYMAWDDTAKALVEQTGDAACTEYTVVTGSDTWVTWSAGWYVVNSNVTIAKSITVTGDVNLILCDGASLTAGGFELSSASNSLTIYAGSTQTNIAGTGSLTVNSQYNAFLGASGPESGGTLTINGGAVSLSSTNCAFNMDRDGILNINGGTFTASSTGDGQSAIKGTTVTVNGGSFEAVCNNAAALYNYDFTKIIVADGLTVKAGDDEDSAEEVTDLDAWAHTEKWVHIEKGVKKYPLWVGGVQIDGNNKDDVFGDGTVSYTPATETTPATLTLNGYSYTGEGYKNAAIYANEALTIKLADGSENMVTHTATDKTSYGILVNGNKNLTITGSGTLIANGGDTSGYHSYGIFVGQLLSIDANAIVKVKGGSCQYYSYGVDAHYGLHINGTLEASGGSGSSSYGIYNTWDFVINSGSFVTATGDTVAIYGTVKNAIAGTGWTDAAGTEGKADVAISADGQSLTYKKVQFPAAAVAVTSVTLDKNEISLTVGGEAVKLTATIAPENATDKKVLWAVFQGSDKIKLYSDSACTKEVGSDATETLIVYAKGIAAGSVVIDVTSSTAHNIFADCAVTVTKETAVPATVTANNRTYDGTEKPLVTVSGTPTGGTMYYALGENVTTAPADDLYTTSIPSKANAGTYYVWYKAVGDENHLDTEAASITVTVAKKAVTVTAADQTVKLNENIDTAVSNATLTGAVEGDVLTAVTLTAGSTQAVTTQGTITVSAATIKAGADGEDVTANYEITYQNGKLTVEKVPVTITVQPEADNRSYDGTEKPLLKSAGTADGGTILYALGDNAQTAPLEVPLEGYSETIPTAVDPGTYYVWCKVAEDENHEAIDPFCITVEIAVSGILGDVNGDGIVDIADALMISRYDSELTTLNKNQLALGDITGDGIVDIADALYIARLDAGLLEE